MRIRFLLFLGAVLSASVPMSAVPDHWQYAPTPPMGWNSWDIFGTTLTEEQARAQAAAMAEHLLPVGYDVFTVDIQWYEPNAKGHAYKAGASLSMDAYSRLLPAPEKFPSAADGAGFKPLADYVHGLGLRFGIHLMRGIPRQAVHQNTAIFGADVRAADIADTDSICLWNPDMYGVDMTKEGAQDYYDSLFALYASWGVDYVKVDDIARPYDTIQKAEIEAIRAAIDKSGRPMVLSLSPGATPLEAGPHVQAHANLWRISDDFWDRWEPLYEMFERLHNWTPYRENGAWPDADMLPLGIIDFGRPTNFTAEEQRLCMTLWAIARSPLIFGGDMTQLDAATIDLLTNPEMLAVNQHSAANRQLSREEDLIVWTADAADGKSRYVALFNAQSNHLPYDLDAPTFRSRVIRGEPEAEIVEIDLPLHGARRLVLAVQDGGDGTYYDQVAWIEPTVHTAEGELRLMDLEWGMASSGWREARKGGTVDDQPLTMEGQPLDGIGTHSLSVIDFELPEPGERFTAKALLTAGSGGRGSAEFLVLVDPEKRLYPPVNTVGVSLEALGFDGAIEARDLWAREDLGRFEDVFSREIPLHGAGLYRLTPVEDAE